MEGRVHTPHVLLRYSAFLSYMKKVLHGTHSSANQSNPAFKCAHQKAVNDRNGIACVHALVTVKKFHAFCLLFLDHPTEKLEFCEHSPHSGLLTESFHKAEASFK